MLEIVTRPYATVRDGYSINGRWHKGTALNRSLGLSMIGWQTAMIYCIADPWRRWDKTQSPAGPHRDAVIADETTRSPN